MTLPNLSNKKTQKLNYAMDIVFRCGLYAGSVAGLASLVSFIFRDDLMWKISATSLIAVLAITVLTAGFLAHLEAKEIMRMDRVIRD